VDDRIEDDAELVEVAIIVEVGEDVEETGSGGFAGPPEYS